MSVKINGLTGIEFTSNTQQLKFKGDTQNFNLKTVGDDFNIYNNDVTKLWGMSSAGLESKPNVPGFVAFASGNSNYLTVNAGVPFPGNNVNYNQGGCYDTTTYKFTAPKQGLYFFAFSSIKENTSSSRPMFYVNDSSTYNQCQHGICGGSGNASNSTSSLIYLQLGDSVYAASQSGSLYYYGSGHSTFSGFLIG